MKPVVKTVYKIVITCLLIMPFSSKLLAAPFIMAYNQDWEPFSSGIGTQVKGVLVDRVNEIFSNLGVEVEHIGVPWNRVQSGVELGQFDGFISVPTHARLNYSNSSEQIIYTIEMKPVVSIGANSHITEAKYLKSLRVCDIYGNGWARSFYSSLNIKAFEAPTVDNCLKMIDKGRMDVIVQPADVTKSKIEQLDLVDKLEILSPVFGKMEFTLLVSKESNYQQMFIDRVDQLLKTSNY